MIEAKLASLEDIKTVLLDDDIYNRACDDYCPPKEEFEIPLEGILYIGGYVDGEIASIYIVHGDENHMHFAVLKKFRHFASELLRKSEVLGPEKVVVRIPTLYMSVINFALKHGFRQIGIEQGKHLKNGIQYDRHVLIRERI